MAVGYSVIVGKRYKKEARQCCYEALELCLAYQQVFCQGSDFFNFDLLERHPLGYAAFQFICRRHDNGVLLSAGYQQGQKI